MDEQSNIDESQEPQDGKLDCARWQPMCDFPMNAPDGTIVVFTESAQNDCQTWVRNFGAWFGEDDTEYHDEELGLDGFFIQLPKVPSK